MEYADQLGVSDERFERLLEHTERRVFRGRRYRLLPDARQGIERGTVLIDGTVVRGFPSIPRVLVLEAGIESFFDDEFAVEEKLNGYNVRVARVEATDTGADTDVLAFTRSGYACPFTTYHVDRLLSPDSFFEAHPDLMLCGEMYGPENPYTAHEYSDVDTVDFRVFSIRDRVTGEPLTVDERRRLCAEYDFPSVTGFGRFDPSEADAVMDIVTDLNERGREGIVMKSPDGADQLKYTTSTANQEGLAYAFQLPFDYGRDFVFGRLVREAFQSVEWDESDEERAERAHELGESILRPMTDAIRTVQDGAHAGDAYTIRGDGETLTATLSQLRDLGLTIDVNAEYTSDGDTVIEFVKRSSSTTDKVRYYLGGGTDNE